jgi:hypothetical protein
MRRPLKWLAAAVSALALAPSPARAAAGAAYDTGVAKQYVSLAYAAACAKDDLYPAWKCPWCKKVDGAYAGFKPDAYVAHAKTNGAAFTGYNAATKEIFVVYRSTVLTSWRSILVDFTFDKVDFKSGGAKHGQVHRGFNDAYFALDQAGVGASVARLLQAHKDASVVLVGHSLGGALVTMAAADLGPKNPARRFYVYSFGAPRLGDQEFAAWFGRLPNVVNHRAVTADDPVPHTPKLKQGFVHVDSSQEHWFKQIPDAQPQACPKGDSQACSNQLVAPANFAGAHASYLGLKFDQCGIGAIAEVTDWANTAHAKLSDAGATVASAAKDTGSKVEKAGEKVEEKAKDAGGAVVTGTKKAGEKAKDLGGKVLKGLGGK